jgi:predicted nucleotidyltransferase
VAAISGGDELKGFDHVFINSVKVEIAAGFHIRVITLPVLVLLKMVAYLDNSYSRAKDIGDIAHILRNYAIDSDMRFSDPVLEANVTFDVAGALLIGRELRSLCNPSEVEVVETFLGRISNAEDPAFRIFAGDLPSFDNDQDRDNEARQLIGAFRLGFSGPNAERM